MQNLPIIIYGAGQNAQKHYNDLKSKYKKIVAFCDKDENKIGKIIDNLPVLSKKQVKEKYKKILISISAFPPVRYEIQNELIDEKFVCKEDILNFEETFYAKGCYSLYNTAIISEESIYCCCILGEDLRAKSPYIKWGNSIEESIEKFLKYREELQQKIKNGEPTPCDSCSELKYGWYPKKNIISILAISPSYPCQLKCSYCDVPSNMKFKDRHEELFKKVNKFDLLKALDYLEKRNVLNLNFPVQIAAGEISINPKKEEILTAFEKYPLQIFSNCIVYDTQISNLISRDGSFLNVSIDAGTRETYKKVKGLDVFDKVIENLIRYSNEGANIEIKYILLSENCDRENLDGFIELCKKININKINISCDINLDHNNLDENIVKAAIYIAKSAKKNNIQYQILPYFGDRNMKYIEENLN